MDWLLVCVVVYSGFVGVLFGLMGSNVQSRLFGILGLAMCTAAVLRLVGVV